MAKTFNCYKLLPRSYKRIGLIWPDIRSAGYPVQPCKRYLNASTVNATECNIYFVFIP